MKKMMKRFWDCNVNVLNGKEDFQIYMITIFFGTVVTKIERKIFQFMRWYDDFRIVVTRSNYHLVLYDSRLWLTIILHHTTDDDRDGLFHRIILPLLNQRTKGHNNQDYFYKAFIKRIGQVKYDFYNQLPTYKTNQHSCVFIQH